MDEPVTPRRARQRFSIGIQSGSRPRGRSLVVSAVLALAGSAAAAPVTGQEHDLRFDLIGLRQGLSQSVVTAIVQDPTGFIWLGTQGGLNRYDGHEFLVLEHVIADTTSLPDDYVKALLVDDAGRLWVGTQGGGLSRLNERHDGFRTFRHRENDPTSLSHNAVYVLAQASNGDILVGTFAGGLNRFDRDNERFTRVPVRAADRSRGSDLISSLAVADDGTVWVGTEGAGAFRLDAGSDSLRAVGSRGMLPGTPDNVRALLLDHRQRVWLARDDGVYQYDAAADVFVRQGEPTWMTGGGTVVTALLETALDGLWIGTYGEGLHAFDPRAGRYRKAAEMGSRDGIADNRVYRLYEDGEGGYWVSVWGSGVHRIRELSGLFAVATPDPARPGSITSGDITGLAVDGAGRLLVGTFDGGLNVREPGSSAFRAFRRGAGPRGLPSDQVSSLAEDTGGRIWVGFWDAGLVVVEGDRVVRRFAAGAPDDRGALPGNRIRTLHPDRDGAMWVGGLRGAARYDPATDRFSRIPVEGTVFALHRSRDGALWAGTLQGLVRYAPGSGRIRRFLPDPSDPRSLSHSVVSDIHETPDGTLWIATRGGGINRVHREPDGAVWFEAFAQDQGLADNDVVGIAGGNAVLWITSKNGLTRFDVRTHTSTNFRESAGLPSADFNPGTVLLRGDSLYLGSGRGFIVAELGGYLGSDAPSPLVVTALDAAGDPLEYDGAPWNTRRVRLPYGGILSIQVALLEFAETENHQYQYRLGASDRPWTALGDRRNVAFAHLGPGRHIFVARGRNQRGIESQTPPLIIEVQPPFWMTGWFRLLAALALAGAILGGYRSRTAAIRRHNEHLRASRERMRTLAVGIENAREAERTRIAREIHDQFGQALTSLKLDCQWLRRRVDGRQEPVSNRLTAMMEIIDGTAHEVRRIGAELRPSVLDNLGLAAAVRWQAREFQARTGVQTRVHGPDLGLDRERATALFRILQEALTNVARHAEATSVEISLASTPDTVDLTVADNGRGMEPRADTERTFGLIGMEERAQTWGGTLIIDSAPGRGTTVTVRMPTRTPTSEPDARAAAP